ncbi:MAG: hypothetical protein L6R42_000763 [Xanthoria sp. 1 TBL-2021]|nr:MAG: hypothetical protein L6R42_000763 [Xanthoria sp. 1 TBL-2021]
MQSTTWSPMVSGPEDDFSTFLEFGDLQLNFPSFDANPQNGGEIQNGVGPAIDLQTSDNPGAVLDFHHGGIQQFGDPSGLSDFNGTSQDYQDLSMPPQLFEQQQQLLHQYPQHPSYGPSYNGHHVVPPTPNSIEMHGGHAQYQHLVPNNHARAMYEQQRRQPKGQAAFTPLVSPAVTPHDAQFQYQDYSVPSEFFSPLTSPALEAQNHGSQRSVYSAVRGSDTSDTTSPIDMNIDPSLQPFVASAARKPRRRTSSTAQRNPPQRAVRQSPSMKPQSKKKQLSSTSIPPKRVTGIIEDAENARTSSHTYQQTRSKGPISRSHESSEAESISPEPLSEVLMPPPATPKSASASKSPQIVPATSGPQPAPMPATDDKPATPSSLMRIRNAARRSTGSALKEQTSVLEAQLEQTMEAMTSPETSKASSKRPALTPLRTSDTHDDETTPTMSARKTPKIAPTSAPVTATGSSFTSPNLNPMGSPNGSLHTRRGDALANGRGGKKRTNSSSVQVSPALRPRISPSIKPLLPDGGHVSAETSALLLASKSNYQNLVEGTHLPGVSYPETLSTNLTSKRTSHKIAEQGRRNRINTALQEIAALLPPTPNGATPKDGMNGLTTSGKVTSPGASVMLTGTAAQQSNSKASTVELAIDYIKTLQGELQEVKEKLQLAEQKLAKDEEQRTVAAADGDIKKTTTTMTKGDGGTNGNDDG